MLAANMNHRRRFREREGTLTLFGESGALGNPFIVINALDVIQPLTLFNRF
ncbi:hypothetical protein KIN20_013136 [Parelaphostrongylus tenuis]|uniref:Uncharacterized protein n=1 Tax=Parelaphostrongylus tenuis TaxID=148309 RepID=A0AAD5MF34_PARTN|nr:hypothetical protein KIN20_013136 [Parelaphostrongylus tenuis]